MESSDDPFALHFEDGDDQALLSLSNDEGAGVLVQESLSEDNGDIGLAVDHPSDVIRAQVFHGLGNDDGEDLEQSIPLNEASLLPPTRKEVIQREEELVSSPNSLVNIP